MDYTNASINIDALVGWVWQGEYASLGFHSDVTLNNKWRNLHPFCCSDTATTLMSHIYTPKTPNPNPTTAITNPLFFQLRIQIYKEKWAHRATKLLKKWKLEPKDKFYLKLLSATAPCMMQQHALNRLSTQPWIISFITSYKLDWGPLIVMITIWFGPIQWQPKIPTLRVSVLKI